jgi:hypothetical protein
MSAALTRIARLTEAGYRLRLERNLLTGACHADLSRRVWLFKKHVHIVLEKEEFDSAKLLLGDDAKRRIRRVAPRQP